MSLLEMCFDENGLFTMRAYALGRLMEVFDIASRIYGKTPAGARLAVVESYVVLHYIDPEFADALDNAMGIKSVQELAADESQREEL